MYSCAQRGNMARMKYPGTNRARCAAEKRKKLKMSGRMKTQQLDQNLKSTVITPVVISLRRYREIFGDSDEEEEEFYGFRAEDLGLKAYRSFSVKDYLDGSERVSYRKDGARDRQSRYSVGNSPVKLPTEESPQRKSNGKETENKLLATSPGENVYAKQYRKRDSYERRFARPSLEFDKACNMSSPNVKSTTKVRANFVPRVQKPVQREGSSRLFPVNTYEVNLFPYNVKKKAVPLAKQLLAKAKEGQRIRKQKKLDAVNKDSQQVRSRFGRVVKSKKLDYDDLTSPKYKARGAEAKAGSINRVTHKRRLEDGEVPPNKTLRLAEVKLEKMELPADQRVYVNNPESPTGFEIQPLSAAEVKASKFGFTEDSSMGMAHAFTRKVRIKNANRMKHVINARNRHQRAKFPGHGVQRSKNIRTSISSQASELDGDELDNNDGSMKRSERIKIKKKTLELSAIKRREEDLEDQASDASSISEVSTLSGDVSNRKTPGSANRYVFKSKRLQELQEKMDDETTADGMMAEETSSGEIISRRDSKDRRPEEGEVCTNSDNERSSRPRSRRQSQEQGGNHADEGQEPVALKKKKRVHGKKTSLSRLQALKNDDGIHSSSEDEESHKPLSQVKRDIKKERVEEPEEQEELTERVVKRIIKVVKKIRTKSGETKTKVVKIIKKIGLRRKVPLQPGRRRIRCGNCSGCRIKRDCGGCRWCKDKPKFGGPGTSKQSCVNRKCVNPQPPKPKGGSATRAEKADSNVTVKRKLPPKKENGLKLKYSKKGQGQRQGQSSSSAKKPAAHVKPPPFGRRQALVDNRHLVKLPWSDNSTEEEIWKEGFAVCFTAGVPSVVKELCFLCGSRGKEKMFYCRVCAEPFHGFCLDEEPVDESTWCCDNCSSCSVCGYQDKLLMCDRCQRGYHVECLGPCYPTEPEGEDDVWVCGRCVQCKNCGRRTAGDNPEALWMLEFTHCQDCGRQREQDNFCPLCDKCYSDDDFESKMVHCVECDHWVHAECQGITVDQYECLSDLPDSVQFLCRQCCEDQVTSPWYKELMEEMEAGYERIVDEIKSCKAYEQFSSHFEQLQADNGYPKDLDAILAKVKDQTYITVESFCEEVTKVLDKVFRLVETDPLLTKQWSSLYITFCKELASMFPWHKLKSKVDDEENEENRQPCPPNGIIGPSISYEVWDHCYVSLKDNQEKSETSPEMKPPSPCSEALQGSSLSTEQETNADEVKMETDNNQDEQKEQVVSEEPMETDSNAHEQQQQQQEQETTNLEDTDKRKCLLCSAMRDADSPDAGRLLGCGLDEWVHVNCGLWSAEVFEDDEGRLQNVQAAISRGKQMKCEHCGEVGATVGCCEPRCPMNYHFMCARKTKAEFQDDKKVYCAQHSFRVERKLLMENDDFCVERRVCVDMSKIRATKKLSRGFEAHSINLVQGSLTVENMGKLSEYSDTKQTLYPISYRTSRLYWSVKDPTKRCRYFCTVEEKVLKSTRKKPQQEIKDLIDQQHLHKVISHEEVNKKDKLPKNMSSSHGDAKNMAAPLRNNTTGDYLNSSYGKKLKRIAPHPGPSLINHSVFPGVLFKDTNLGATSAHIAKLRRILPAPQKSLPSSPTQSPRKLIEHLNRQTNHLPAIINPVYVEKSSPTAACASQKVTTPSRSRKTPPAAKRTISFEDTIPQTVRQLNCDHEVVAKSGDGKLPNSPVKEKSAKSWLVSRRERENALLSEELCVSFVITSDDGIRIEANTCEAAWKQVFDMVQEARIDRHMKMVPFAGVNGKAMFGVHQESVVSMLEQLPGAHQLKEYSFKYNPSFDVRLEETQALKENPHGCARAEEFDRTKKYDMFAFLASIHRVAPQMVESTEDQDNNEQMRDGPMTVKRPTCLDLPMAMRYRHLKQCSFNKDAVAVYRSPIHGRGLFCTRNIAAGEMVIEYSGMLVRSVLTDKREKYYESKGIGCYMFRVDGTFVVDATMCGNAARFINHSCECNCYSRVINVDGQKKIIIFASRSISRGEELTYDYKFPIEDEKLPCLCTSKHCRKYLN